MLGKILDRLKTLVKEPSTWAGIAASLAGIGILGFSEDQWMQIFGAVGLVAGGIASVMRDRGDH